MSRHRSPGLWKPIAPILLLGLFFALGVYATQATFTSRYPGANDFYSRWKGAELFWKERLAPYSDEATLAIQQGIYGTTIWNKLSDRAMGNTRRSEWLWLVVVAGLIMAASTLPHLAGHLAQAPEWHFRGSLMNEVDYSTYLAEMWQGYRGAWQYHLPFTTEEHSRAYLVTFYIALGHLARVAHLGLPLTYQLVRCLAS